VQQVGGIPLFAGIVPHMTNNLVGQGIPAISMVKKWFPTLTDFMPEGLAATRLVGAIRRWRAMRCFKIWI
jgi:hypothetical protein